MAILGPIEALEHHFAFSLGNAGAAVVDFHARAALLGAGSQDHSTAWRSEFDGITQQVAKGFEEQGTVAVQLR
ncbi:hypothetical protein D3C76_1807180 [compost metagenome]